MGHEIAVRSGNIAATIRTLATHFKARTIDDNVEQKLTLPPSAGEGFISGIDLQGGLSTLFVNVKLEQPLTLNEKVARNHPLRFLFSLENPVHHNNRNDGLQYTLDTLTGSIVASRRNSEESITIAANKATSLFCILIDRAAFQDKISKAIINLPDEGKRLFTDTQNEYSFFHKRPISLGIAQCLHNIRTNGYRDLVKRMYLESQVLNIFSMQVHHYINDLAPARPRAHLRKRDIQLVEEARDMLLKDLLNPPTIKELAQLTGTNENKLKAGFRQLYNTTINKMLQDERLSRAKELMAEEKHTIREIARMVGYGHPAHFASKFRKRFGMLPNEYIKSIR